MLGSVAAMVDEERRRRLLALKLAALIRDHWTTHDLQTTSFALGSAARDGDTGWVLLDERPHRGLGPALAWAIRAGVDRLHVLAEEGTGTLGRRAAAFRLPIEVWHVAERVLLPAIAEPLAGAVACAGRARPFPAADHAGRRNAGGRARHADRRGARSRSVPGRDRRVHRRGPVGGRDRPARSRGVPDAARRRPDGRSAHQGRRRGRASPSVQAPTRIR